MDIDIHAREFLRQRRLVDEILAHRTGQPVAKVSQDTDRDFILTADQAKAYGVVDEVIDRRSKGLARFDAAEPTTGNGMAGP